MRQVPLTPEEYTEWNESFDKKKVIFYVDELRKIDWKTTK